MGRLLLGISLGFSLLIAAGTAPASAAGGGGRYFPVAPARILDTRVGVGAPSGRLAGGGTLNLTVAGRGGVPVGATAVVLNVTVTDTTANGYVTVWPAGGTVPLASSLNFAAGQTLANLVQVPIGAGGQVSIFASVTLSVIADAQGWVNAVPAGPDGRFNPLVPMRLVDTRTGLGSAGKAGPATTLSVGTLGRAGVPASGVSAVVLNLTVTNPTTYGYLTAWPHGLAQPLASNINFGPGQTVANRVMVGVGQSGWVDIYNGPGSVDIIVDISGWFTDVTGTTGSIFVGLAPTRILDTRTTGAPLHASTVRAVQVAGQAGVPAMGAPGAPTAVVANVTVTNTSAPGYLTAWPDGFSLPLASDLNWPTGDTVPNLVVVALGPNGMVDFYNGPGNTELIIDILGYYTGPALPLPSAGATMANLINQDRAAAGVAPLQWSSCLANVAVGESSRQAAQGYISHAGGVYLDLGCGYSTAGENVGYTSAGIDDNQLNTLFMNSPGHRANILNPNFHVVGTAWVLAPNGFGYVTEEFAA